MHVYGPGNRKWEYDSVDRHEYRQKEEDCHCKLPAIIQKIPEDWIVDDEFLPSVQTPLEHGAIDEF